ncbi:MAG: DUF58 domain-containing protein [bacterium]|nr:DUF58 domain-containing protein [bacterium]
MRERALLDARGLRLRARRDVSTSLAGAFRSAFRGNGLTFEELREYSPGDDVRWIEWNATARMGRPIVKRMREERDQVLALLVDLSDSLDYGFGNETKRVAVQRAAAALASAAVYSQDRVALATFADGLVDRLAPAGGPLQLERAFQMLARPGAGAPTRMGPALDWAADTLPRHSLVVVISDFLLADPGATLRRCARKHELVALRVVDPADRIPERGAQIRVVSAEGNRTAVWRRNRARQRMQQGLLEESLLKKIGADVGRLRTGNRLVPSLLRFFEARARRAA